LINLTFEPNKEAVAKESQTLFFLSISGNQISDFPQEIP